MRDRILGVEAAALEVAAEQPIQLVRAGLGDGVHLHARRPSLRRVELVGDELELRDRVLAEARLVAGAELGADLLAVQIELELTLLAAVAIRQRRRGVGRRGTAARREQRERHPVASLCGKLRHLLRIDVATEPRRRRLDERRLAGDRDGFLQRRGRHLQVDRRGLADQEVDALAIHGAEAGQRSGDPVRTDTRGDAIDAAGIGHRLELVAGSLVDGHNGHTRQHAAGGVRDGAGQRRFLREDQRGKCQEGTEKDQSPHNHTRPHRTSSPSRGRRAERQQTYKRNPTSTRKRRDGKRDRPVDDRAWGILGVPYRSVKRDRRSVNCKEAGSKRTRPPLTTNHQLLTRT